MKDPEDKKRWIVDEEAAAIVQKIFSLCVDGLGPTQIAKWLQQNNVLNPTAYAHEKGLPVCNAPTANPCKWTAKTISGILERVEYLGHTVNFKTSKPSFKSKKKVWNNPSEWVIFKRIYEDNALGRLSNEQFAFLTSGYDEEKKTLTRRIAELTQEIDNAAERSADVKRFVALVRRYTEISELTYENVHEFIDRILIHELDRETNTRKIEIFYSFVGKVDSGEQPTESVSYFRQIGADVKSFAV